MTEEIIIDGVNVAGCCCYENGKCLWTKRYYESDVAPDCEKIKDCYYKQLKRLGQENKELKISNSNLDNQLYITKEMMNNCNNRLQNYRSAFEEILESAKFAQCLPCGSGNLEDCLNCNDDTTNNGQFCMEKRIHDIKTKCVEVLNHSEG